MTGSNLAGLDLKSLPPGIGQPGSLIVVDILYQFKPSFGYWLTGPITFQQSAYFAPRYYTQLAYNFPGAKAPTTLYPVITIRQP